MRACRAFAMQGAALLRANRAKEASSSYRQSLARAKATPDTRPALRAHIESQLAKALWQAGRKREALQAAESALRGYDQLPHKKATRDELDAWLSARRGETLR